MASVILESTVGAFETKTSLPGKPVDKITQSLTKKNGDLMVEWKKDEKTEKFLAEVPTEISLLDIRGKEYTFNKNFAQSLLDGYSFLKIYKINKEKVVEQPVVVEPEKNKKDSKDEKASV